MYADLQTISRNQDFEYDRYMQHAKNSQYILASDISDVHFLGY